MLLILVVLGPPTIDVNEDGSVVSSSDALLAPRTAPSAPLLPILTLECSLLA